MQQWGGVCCWICPFNSVPPLDRTSSAKYFNCAIKSTNGAVQPIISQGWQGFLNCQLRYPGCSKGAQTISHDSSQHQQLQVQGIRTMSNVCCNDFRSYFQALAAAQFLCCTKVNINTSRQWLSLPLISAPYICGATANTLITQRKMSQNTCRNFFEYLH